MRSRTQYMVGLAGVWTVAALLTVGLTPRFAAAQQQGNVTWLDDGDTKRVSISEIRSQSRFRLFGEGDRAFSGMRPTGNMEYFITNTGIVDAADLPFDGQPDMSGTANGTINQWFDVGPMYGAPRSEWERFIANFPSLLNARGQGYTVSANHPTLGWREILASDLQFGNLFAGVTSTTDGGCQDFSGPNPSGNQDPGGTTLLAISNCPATWPDVAGTPTFLGDNVIPDSAYGFAQAVLGQDFNFDWWRVDPSFVDQGAFFGNIQAYGAYDDYNSSQIGRYGSVIPGQSGDPENTGWPLGIRTEFNAITYALPTVSNTMFWRAIVINNSAEVYGEPGLDYENLYLGYGLGPIRSQESTFYMEVWRGAILTAEGGTSTPRCPGVGAPGVGNIPNNDCQDDQGFNSGATGMIVLKSPIGDLRNVLLSCDPAEAPERAATRAIPCTTDAFRDFGNPHARDTITYNHFRMCDFGGCTNQVVLAPERQWFGGMASNTEDLLNGRDPGTLSARDLYNTFKNPNFPQQPTPFAHWVPGTWDYTANGDNEPLGDTLWVPTCYGSPDLGRDAREDACVVTWSDTMPTSPGEEGNPAYHNQEGNIAFMSLGPFKLAAGDTAGFVIAMVAGVDSTRFEAEVNNAINLYMNFFLAPAPPAKTNLVGAATVVEDPATGRGNGEVLLFLDDAAETSVDQFLIDFAINKVQVGSTPRLARLRDLNDGRVLKFDTVDVGPPVEIDTTIVQGPSLVDRILERANDNLAELLIFKSCDGGATFTENDTDARGDLDCDADPAVDTEGAPVDVGWESYATLEVDENGNAPNRFRDQLVVAGQTYLYAILGRTRGAQFAVIDSVDIDGDGTFDTVGPDSLVIAPSLLNPLATSTTEPNVVSVYVPASIEAGGRIATATAVGADPSLSTAPRNFVFTGGDVVEDTFELVFANEIRVEEFTNAGGGLDSTRVTARDVVTAEVMPGVAADTSIDTRVWVTRNLNGVQAIDSLDTNDDGVIDEDDGFGADDLIDRLGFVLVRQSTGEPLFASSVLDSANTTPSSVFNRQAVGTFTGFPGFILEVDNEDPGGFDRRFWAAVEEDTVASAAQPLLDWDDDASSANQGGGVTAFGTYQITWSDKVFGPDELFTLNQANSAVTDADFDASLEARRAGSVGRTDAAAAALIGVDEADLVAVNVPFTVRNVTFGRDVDVAMVRRTKRILLGNAASGDTVSVTVPDDQWVPDDELIFIETVELDSVVRIGSTTALVLGSDGKPIKVQREVVTFDGAVLNCGDNPRPTCNPVRGVGSTNPPFVTTFQDQVLSVLYRSPFRIETELVFDVAGAISGSRIVASGADIRAQMDSIKVVPNPYIMFSEYQVTTPQGDDARLMFTHLPPSGNLRIYTVSGQFVQELRWTPADLAGNGDLFWNMRTREGNEAAAGLYLFVVNAVNPATGNMEKKIGKFVIIR